MNKQNLTKLYSSINLKKSLDIQKFSYDIENNKNNKKLKLLIHMIGEYNSEEQPNIYFKAKIILDYIKSTKNNILITKLNFKNDLNVSSSSQIIDYEYLYSDNKLNNSSSNISIDSMFNNNIENKIIEHIKNFILNNNSFNIENLDTFILNTRGYQDGIVFPNLKMTIKHKFVKSISHSINISNSISKINSININNINSSNNKLPIISLIGIIIAILIKKN